MTTKKIKILLGITFLAISFNLSTALTDNLYAQKRDNKQNNVLNKSVLTKEPVLVVKKYWIFLEDGFATQASELRTSEFKNFAIIINRHKHEKSREDLILKLGWRFISIDEVIIHSKDKWEIAVKIKDKKMLSFINFSQL